MNKSLWIAHSEGTRFKPLGESIDVNILIIGGGLVGISTALMLSKEGLDVTIVDSDLIGHGTSGRNTGKLTAQTGLIYSNIKKMYGIDKAKAFYKSNQEAFSAIKKNIEKYHLDCNFEEMPSYVFSERLNNIEAFEEEYRVYEELGIEGEFVNRLVDLPLDIKVAISQTHAGGFNPKKYIDGLVPILIKHGVKIYEKSPVTQMNKGDSSWEVMINDKYKIKADKVILCSHYPFYDNYSFYVTRLRPEASYIVAADCQFKFPHASFINVDNPKRSFRPYQANNTRWLLIGGENHKVGQSTANHCEELMEYGKSMFGLKDYAYAWRAQGYMTPDTLPYIGYLNEHSDNIYVATGFNKWGNLNSTVAAKLITELILEKRADDTGLYDPSRGKGYFTTDYIKDNVNTAYEWVKSKLEPTSKELPKDNDTAEVVKIDGKKYGAYKDKKGHMHIVDITCPHMGAELNWNGVEKTWDCPCHGSRFTYDGDIVEGPATYRLNRYETGKNNHIDPKVLQS